MDRQTWECVWGAFASLVSFRLELRLLPRAGGLVSLCKAPFYDLSTHFHRWNAAILPFNSKHLSSLCFIPQRI